MTVPLPVVLLCCFNRKAKTLACLQSLYRQGVAVSVVLVDDGSTDGTAEAVCQQFPQVVLLTGNGSLYWNGAMRLAWQHALALFAKAPAFIWLNDDVRLDDDALSRLLATVAALPAADLGAVTAAMREPAGHAGHQLGTGDTPLSYGGRRSRSRWFPLRMGPLLPLAAVPQSCDFIHGNLCYIPAQAVERVGILSPHYTHAMGDYDYGLRLKKAGLRLYQAPGSFGECASNSDHGGVLDASVPFAKRLAMLQQPNRWPPAREWRYFVSQHGGPWSWLLQLPVLLRQYCPALFLLLRQRQLPPPASADAGQAFEGDQAAQQQPATMAPRHIVQLHQQYRQPGGEDQVVARELALLQAHGLPVQPCWLAPVAGGLFKQLALVAGWFGWPQRLPALVGQLGEGDILLVHNLFPALSPFMFSRLRRRGVRIFLTLHNFRPLTPAAVLPPAGQARAPSLAFVLQQLQQPARPEGRLLSLLLALSGYLQHRCGAWWQLERLWCPSEFVRQQYLLAGYPASLLQVKPHFYPVPGLTAPATRQGLRPSARPSGSPALFVGRAHPQKGLTLLLAAYQQAQPHWPDLWVVGAAAADLPTPLLSDKIRFIGALEQQALSQLYQQAQVVVVPSLVSETFGNVVIEAFAHAVPVVAARAGALTELVQHQQNGLLFTPGDVAELCQQLNTLFADHALQQRLAVGAQRSYQQHYTAAQQWPYYQAIGCSK